MPPRMLPLLLLRLFRLMLGMNGGPCLRAPQLS